MAMSGASVERVRAALLEAGHADTIQVFPEGTRTSAEAAAAVGCGVVRPGSGFASLGTSGVVFVPSATLEIDPSGALHAFCHAVPGQYHLMGVILAAGGSLRWYRDVMAAEQAADAQARGVPTRDPPRS